MFKFLLLILLGSGFALAGCSEKSNSASSTEFDPTGYWVVTHDETCGSDSSASPQNGSHAGEATKDPKHQDAFLLKRLDNATQYSLQPGSDGRWTMTLEIPERPKFPLSISDEGRQMSGEASWVIPNINQSCRLTFSAVRYPGPQVCEIMTAAETKAMAEAASAAVDGAPEIQALHQFWADHASKWNAAKSLANGAYEWAPNWSFVTNSTELELRIPMLGTLTYRNLDDGWGSFQANLTGSSMPDWTASYWGPRGLADGSSGIMFGEWAYGYSTCDSVCSGLENILQMAPFGSAEVRRGDLMDPKFPEIKVKIAVAEHDFEFTSPQSGYSMRYADRATDLTRDDIQAKCPNVIAEKLALFPNIGQELVTGFPLDNFQVVW